jgi:transcription antitermination protein NusB
VSRRKGRILALQALYSWDVGNVQLEDLLKFSWVDAGTKADAADDESVNFARLIIAGAVTHHEEIDKLIVSHLTGWEFDRVNKVSLAILRLSVYSLLYQQDLPPTIVIDEAIDLAKEFGSDDSFKFINAVLDNIRKTLFVKG